MSPDSFESGLFVLVGGTGREQHVPSAAKAIKAPVQRRRPLPAAEAGRSCWGRVLIFQSPAKGLRKNQQTQPVALISARFPTPRNVYQERCRQTIRSGGFFCGGQYRTRTAQPRRRRGSRMGPAPANSTKPGTFSGPTAQKGFRVSDFALFLCTSCYRIFILQQPLFFISGDFIFGYRLPCRARRGRNIPSG